MRTLTATAVLSLVVHGAALAWVIATPKPKAAPEVGDAAAPLPPEDELTIVELLPDPVPATAPARGVAATVAPASTPRRRPGSVSAAEAAIGATASTAAATETRPPTTTVPPTAPPPASVLGMRSGPQVVRTAEQLATLALAHPEGVTELPDYPGLRTSVALEMAKARYKAGDPDARSEIVAARVALAEEELKPQKDGTWTSDKTTFVAKVDKDGTVRFQDKPNLQVHPLGATFDATDAIMRSKGMDPYASEKLKYLDKTRDQRVEIGRAYRKEQLSHSDQLVNANLVRLWSTTHDVAARKQGLFEMWDECAESGEAELVEGGRTAREMVERWTQVKLTAADRFTTDELAQLNAHRHSRSAFDPYR